MAKRFFSLSIIILTVTCFFVTEAAAQQNKKPVQQNKKSENGIPDWNKKVRTSPRTELKETIGLTDVTVSYSRPGVKGRKIWGGLVPYDKVWRAGANEATKITFGGDVTIHGKKLAAGSYGFFVIPTKKDWTVIFNKISDQWGAFTYNESEDAMRFTVKTLPSNFHEWLAYSFTDMKVNEKGNNSAVLNLMWEKVKLPITIETEVNK